MGNKCTKKQSVHRKENSFTKADPPPTTSNDHYASHKKVEPENDVISFSNADNDNQSKSYSGNPFPAFQIEEPIQKTKRP